METPLHSRTWAEINLNALRTNYKNLTAMLPEETVPMAVVKANAYGHGAKPVAHTLAELGCRAFAVATPEEGEELRKDGISGLILVLDGADPAHLPMLKENDLTVAVSLEDDATALSEAAVALSYRLPVHLTVDVGMGRMGLPLQQEEQLPLAVATAERLASLPGLQVTGVFTHFPCADLPDCPETDRQQVCFSAFCAALRAHGVDTGLCHCANSAASLRGIVPAPDMVRLGISLYGIAPDNQPHGSLAALCPVEPIMSLKTRIYQVRPFSAGETVGYGSTLLSKDTAIALAPVGYADGYPRLLSGKGHALLRGNPIAITGRVCMDLTMFDVGTVPASAGDTVLLFGKDDLGMLPAETVAAQADTIAYELVCGVSPRVPRVYL